MKRWTLVVLLLGLLQAGCSTVQVERGKDVSSAGIAYSKATAAVIDLAVDASINASSERQIRRGLRATTVPDELRARETTLKELDAELVRSVQAYIRLKRSVGTVEAYFAGLQTLSGATPGDAAEGAVKSLVDRVNGLNDALSSGTKLSDEKKGAIAGFAKLLDDVS